MDERLDGVKIGCKCFKALGNCPLADVMAAGTVLNSGRYWCKDYAQQAICVNEVNAANTKKISHRAEHGKNTHKVDIPRSTSTGSIETAQSPEKLSEFNKKRDQMRQVLIKHGVSTSDFE